MPTCKNLWAKTHPANIFIKNGHIILPENVLKKSGLLISGSKIISVGKTEKRQSSLTIDAKSCFVSAGFIDTHIHGSPERIFENEIKGGTTSILIAESCAPFANIYKKIEKVNAFIKKDAILGPNILGIRLEGPYINKKKAGAQDRRYIRYPDKCELSRTIKRLGPFLKMMTIAPELKGAVSLIRLLDKNGIIASIGHTDATYEDTLKGIAAGAGHATHLFNAMSPIGRRQSGASGALLMNRRVTAEIILDLAHVHPSLFNLLLLAKKRDKIILITDSIRADPPAGAVKKGNVYKFKDGTIAGSSLTMIKALKNAVKTGSLPLEDAVRIITVNPAAMLGVRHKKGSIAVGKDADIVIFDRKFDVKITIVNGEIVYRKAGF